MKGFLISETSRKKASVPMAATAIFLHRHRRLLLHNARSSVQFFSSSSSNSDDRNQNRTTPSESLPSDVRAGLIEAARRLSVFGSNPITPIHSTQEFSPFSEIHKELFEMYNKSSVQRPPFQERNVMPKADIGSGSAEKEPESILMHPSQSQSQQADATDGIGLNLRMHLSPYTQPEPEGSKAKGKDKAKAKTKEVLQDRRVTWSPDEEIALCRAWCSISIDGKVKSFWVGVMIKFHDLMGLSRYRNVAQLSGKWRQININITKFNAIYNKIMSEKRSGMSDFDVMQAARVQYKLEKYQNFDQERQWLILKEDPKWLQTITSEEQQQSKQSRSSQLMDVSDAQTVTSHIDLNAEDDDIPLFDNTKETPSLRRPASRHVGEHREEVERKLGNHIETLKRKLELRLKRDERDEKIANQQILLNSFNILKVKEYGLEVEDLELLKAAKAKARDDISRLV